MEPAYGKPRTIRTFRAKVRGEFSQIQVCLGSGMEEGGGGGVSPSKSMHFRILKDQNSARIDQPARIPDCYLSGTRILHAPLLRFSSSLILHARFLTIVATLDFVRRLSFLKYTCRTTRSYQLSIRVLRSPRMTRDT